MVVVGIVLVLLAAGLGTALYLGTAELTATEDQVQLSVLGTDFGFQPLALVIAGALVMLLLWLGVLAIRLAFRRNRKRKASARDAEARLAAERAESERQAAERGAAQRALAEQRGRSLTDGPSAPGSRMGTAGPGSGALPSGEPRGHAGADSRSDAGADPRSDAGAEPRSDAGAEPRRDAGAEPRRDAGAETAKDRKKTPFSRPGSGSTEPSDPPASADTQALPPPGTPLPGPDLPPPPPRR